MLPIYLEDVELDLGLLMRLVNLQAMFWHLYDTDAEFLSELFAVRMLDCCLGEDGRRRRGVQGRERAGANESSAGRIGFEPRSGLAEYSWAELKALSAAIAAAGSDAEWKAIAREYGLVDGGDRLQGAEKPLKLKDGTDTSVRILGFRHDELAGGGVAGISFEFANVPTTHRMNSDWTNAGGWEKSEMREWLNEGFLTLLPDVLRVSVVAVKKLTNNMGEVKRQNDMSVVSATTDALWLLSFNEVYGNLGGVYGAEGAQYR
ncbi:MAG: DUF6273 domain-containing protein, partial [Coriobacteriales bacterium]|nr:DUF6273 domain-containing protein [Coriobacteriales bacterium]